MFLSESVIYLFTGSNGSKEKNGTQKCNMYMARVIQRVYIEK